MNLFRGCSHGCIYCDSRSSCYNMNHDFEDIEIKQDAAIILADQLKRKRKRGMISTGAMCDSYMPFVETLAVTRECLEVIERYGFGVAIQTKSNLILRDLALLKAINESAKCVVEMTLTTYDEELCRKVEPKVATTLQRVETLQTLHDNGISTVVWLSPFLPFINDSEENLRGLINYCVEVGVSAILCFGIGMTLREGNREYYYAKLDELFPGMKQRYMGHFGNAYSCSSANNAKLMRILRDECTKHGILCGTDEVFSFIREFDNVSRQISLV